MHKLAKESVERLGADFYNMSDMLKHSLLILIDMSGAFDHWEQNGRIVFQLSKELIEAFKHTDIPLRVRAPEFHYPFNCFMIDGGDTPLFETDLKGVIYPVYQIMYINAHAVLKKDDILLTDDGRMTTGLNPSHCRRIYAFIPEKDGLGYERMAMDIQDELTFEEISKLPPRNSAELSCDSNDVHGMINILYNTIMYINDPTRIIVDTEHRESSKFKIGNGKKIRQEIIKLKPPKHYIPLGVGKQGNEINCRFPVRGHWRDQAYGEKLSLRKRLWIFPYWKGPELSQIINKTYKVE